MFSLNPFYDIGLNGTPHVSIILGIDGVNGKYLLRNGVGVDPFIVASWLCFIGIGRFMTVVVEVKELVNNYPLGS